MSLILKQEEMSPDLARAVAEAEVEQLLKRRSELSTALASPYTILVSKDSNNRYQWIAYSIGKIHNMIWGVIEDRIITIDYGCDFRSLKILNNMLDTRKKAGYKVVGTVSKDRITPRFLYAMVLESYNMGNGLVFKDFSISARKLVEMFEPYDELGIPVEESAREVTNELLERFEPNINQYLGTSIPRYVIDLLTQLLERLPSAIEKMPNSCPTLEECDSNYIRECDLYSPSYDVL